ncbi:MAG: hypothetical protein HXY36_00520 [Chloroflexi bacterium]|nr:hypothetical protein [Chloroflexota bacterium]
MVFEICNPIGQHQAVTWSDYLSICSFLLRATQTGIRPSYSFGAFQEYFLARYASSPGKVLLRPCYNLTISIHAYY